MKKWKYLFLIVAMAAAVILCCGCGENRDTGIISIQLID